MNNYDKQVAAQIAFLKRHNLCVRILKSGVVFVEKANAVEDRKKP